MEKACSVCGIIKDLKEYYSQKKQNKEKESYIYYRPDCKECTKNTSVKWSKENPEARAVIQRKANEVPHIKKQRKMWNVRLREDGSYREWQRNNKDRIKEYNKNRDMNKKHEISTIEWQNCKKYFNYSCAYCGIKESEAKKSMNNYLHKEHVIHNGENDLSNCAPSCKKCNSKKWKYSLEEWYNEENVLFCQDRLDKILLWLKHDYVKYIENEDTVL